MTAIRRFIRNEIPVFGSFYREYTDGLQDSIDTMCVHINNLKTRHAVFQWYIDLDTDGTPYSDTEIELVRLCMRCCAELNDKN